MSEQPQKSQHAEILNALDEMQASVAYAARRHYLAKAEQIIVQQEQRIAELEETVSTLTRRDAEQQQREENWQHCFQEFKDLANGKERKYEQIHAVVLKDKIAQLEAQVARLTAERDHLADINNELRNR